MNCNTKKDQPFPATVSELPDVNSGQDVVEYRVNTEHDCRTDAAREAFKMARMLDDVITCGETIVAPLRA